MSHRRPTHPQANAAAAVSEADELLAAASKTRGGGWSVENLLDAIFIATAASVILQKEIVRQNADLLGCRSADAES
ncbi:MAG: hypothetical protein WCJ63_04165 [Actinomycetes bacterium]